MSGYYHQRPLDEELNTSFSSSEPLYPSGEMHSGDAGEERQSGDGHFGANDGINDYLNRMENAQYLAHNGQADELNLFGDAFNSLGDSLATAFSSYQPSLLHQQQQPPLIPSNTITPTYYTPSSIPSSASGHSPLHMEQKSCGSQQLKKEFLEFNNDELQKFKRHKTNNHTSHSTQSLPVLTAVSSSASLGTLSNPPIKGKPLKNFITKPCTFQALPKKQLVPFDRFPSMDKVEINYLLTQIHINPPDLEEEFPLFFYTVLSLSSFYLRCNAIKSFEGFNLNNRDYFVKLRSKIHDFAVRYYSIAISELRKLILKENYNASVAIYVSSYLNKISIYEYPDLNHSIAFSKGTAGIFNDSISNNSKKDDISWTLNFLIFASKSIYFPSHSSGVLHEISKFLGKFGTILKNHTQNDQLIFQYNHLLNYLHNLINLINKKSVSTIREDPRILYDILRKFMLIMPPKLFIAKHLKDKFEQILMNFYDLLARVLDNIFPNTKFFFLQGFKGGISLWYDPNYQVGKDFLFDSLFSLPSYYHDLKKIQEYCVRVSTFFQKRYNILSVFFGDQNLLTENDDDFFSPKEVGNQVNEVMIDNFEGSIINYTNYIHLPCTIKLNRNDLRNSKHLSKFANEIKLYNYNHHHYDFFKNYNLITSTDDTDKTNEKESTDSILRAHMNNLTTNSTQKLLIDQVKSVDIPVTVDSPQISQNPYDSTNPLAEPNTVSYYLVLNEQNASEFTDLINRDYHRIILTGNKVQTTNGAALNTFRGLNTHDKDPLTLVRPSLLLKKRERSQGINRAKVLEFHEMRNKLLEEIGIEWIINQQDEDFFLEDNFYDDMNNDFYNR